MSRAYDLIVVGAGPVGLYAALKAAALSHSVLVIDKGPAFSRVLQAAAIATIPGMPGISGADLLRRLRQGILDFERMRGRRLVTFLDEHEVLSARREEDRYVVSVRASGGGATREETARVLVLATGVVDRKPGIGEFHRHGHETMSPWLGRGSVGYCLLCEGWSLEGERVAVVGTRDESCKVAVAIRRRFGGEVTLLTEGEPGDVDVARLAAGGVRVDQRPVRDVTDEDGAVRVAFLDGSETKFNKILFTLGWYKVNNELAVQLGAAADGKGHVRTTEDSEVLDVTGNVIPGLFAVGDLRAGRWKQIVIGWGDAETAVVKAYAERVS